jgi:hypothetical protein
MMASCRVHGRIILKLTLRCMARVSVADDTALSRQPPPLLRFESNEQIGQLTKDNQRMGR